LDKDQNSAIQKILSLSYFIDILKKFFQTISKKKEKFTNTNKEELNQLKSFLVNHTEDVKKIISNEIDIGDRFLFL
jgi:hypothetical protein